MTKVPTSKNQQTKSGRRPRVILFLWLAVLALIGLYQDSTAPAWSHSSSIEWLAAQFPDFIGILAAVLLMPLYVVSLLEYPLNYLLAPFSSFTYDAFYLCIGLIYLYWLSGWIVSFFGLQRAAPATTS